MANRHFATALASIIVTALIFLPYVAFILKFSMVDAALFTIALLLYIIGFYLASKKIPLSDGTLNNMTFLHITLFSVLMTFTFFNTIFTFAIVVIMAIAFLILKTFSIRDLIKTLFMSAIVFLAATTLFQPAVSISAGAGTVLNDNWFEALNWIRNNTAECATVATYWDPGHFITGIAERPVVFDGASQNSLWNTTAPSGLSEEQIREIAATDKFQATNIMVNGEPKTLIETARIQDIATTLATDNETLAIKILEKYKKPGCNEMYYLATSDLIGKSYWWTYFSSWNPIDKGCATPMSIFNLVGNPRPSVAGGITYTYSGGIPAGCNNQQPGSVIVVQQNDSLAAFVSQNNQLLTIGQFFYFTQTQGILRTASKPDLKGLVWLAPDRGSAIFIPPEIENSMFTRMFFFNGQGLKHFEFINSWGGEVKLFRVRFE